MRDARARAARRGEAPANSGSIAAGITHWAIPQEEALHLCTTVHSGYRQGANKCKGTKAMCAHCLQNGRAVEETAMHEHHACPKSKQVWGPIIADWNLKTGDCIDPADATTIVAGLRHAPAGATGEALQRWKALEPAWRLLHAVTLYEIHKARNRVHAAYHATPQHDPKNASPKHVRRAIKRRVQQRIEFEHARAEHSSCTSQFVSRHGLRW